MKTSSTYSAKINYFEEYIYFKAEKLGEKYLDINSLRNFDEDDVHCCMKFYLDQSKINAITKRNKSLEVTSEKSLYLFLSVLKEYFRFLHLNDINNDKLIKLFGLLNQDKNSLIHTVDKLRKEYNLSNNKLGLEPLDPFRFDALIEKCDESIRIINKFDFDNGK